MTDLLHDSAIANNANLEDEAQYAILHRARTICTMSQSDIPRSVQAAFLKAVAGLREDANNIIAFINAGDGSANLPKAAAQ